MTILAVSFYLALSLAVCWALCRCLRAQPRQLTRAAPKCGCSICTGQVDARLFALTPKNLTEIQAGVIAVGSGASSAAFLGFDHVNERGVGQVVITVTDGAMFEQVILPAIQKRLAARAT